VVIDLEEARARRMGPRLVTTMAVEAGRIVVTFPAPAERLVLTPERARFWRDNLTELLKALELQEG
jgi:hypothetical protein